MQNPKINIKGAVEDVPIVTPEVTELSGIQKAGFRLAVIVLVIVGVYILFVVSLLVFKELDASGYASKEINNLT